MKLELKHLAPYLPYGLKIKVENGIDNGVFELQPVMLTIQDHEGINKFDKWFVQYESKPLLRPLSDLTKEIEYNGERFIPIEKILSLTIYGNKDTSYTWDSEILKIWDLNAGDLTLMEFDPQNIDALEYFIVQMLFEWHFDVFGLINQGLAIRKETLTRDTQGRE